MPGLHLLADFTECPESCAALADLPALRSACLDAARGAGLTVVGEAFHAFAPSLSGGPGGITGVLLLAESHLAVHTWPERAAVTVDLYVCNQRRDDDSRAHAALDALQRCFAPGQARVQAVRRAL